MQRNAFKMQLKPGYEAEWPAFVCLHSGVFLLDAQGRVSP